MIIPKFIFNLILKETKKKWFAIGEKRALEIVLNDLHFKETIMFSRDDDQKYIPIGNIIEAVTDIKNKVGENYLDGVVRREAKDE